MVQMTTPGKDPGSPTGGQPGSKQESGFYEAYAGFARALKTWFVAYGIGGPVVLLTNEKASERLLSSSSARWIAYCFLAGVVLQVVSTLLSKTAMWYLYSAELEPPLKLKWPYKASEWFSDCYWTELLFDLFTLVFFAWATFRVLHALVP